MARKLTLASGPIGRRAPRMEVRSLISDPKALKSRTSLIVTHVIDRPRNRVIEDACEICNFIEEELVNKILIFDL